MESKKEKIWEICNNPLNIRYVKGQIWNGQKRGSYRGFVMFTDNYMCFRAGLKVILTYMGKYGLWTPAAIIGRWAPFSENDTEAYIDFVCSKKSTFLRRDKPLADWTDVEELLTRMSMIETGEPGCRKLISQVIEDMRLQGKPYCVLSEAQSDAFFTLEEEQKKNELNGFHKYGVYRNEA